MAAPYKLELQTDTLKVLIGRTRLPGNAGDAMILGQGVRKAGAIVQARAVRNVTGYPVVYEGGVFRVRVQTGTLRGSIELEWPYAGTVFQARVYVNGSHTSPATSQGGGRVRSQAVSAYAGAIEWGHKAIDLKKTMQGKTIPFFGSRAQDARGPYAAKGLKPVAEDQKGFGSRWQSEALNHKLAAKGKNPMVFEKKGGTGTYFIAFRKVGKKGWIIPEAKPRPFMLAALKGTKDQTRRAVANAAVQMLDPTRRG